MNRTIETPCGASKPDFSRSYGRVLGFGLAELAQEYNIHPNQITDWETQLLERAAQVFDGPKPEAGPELKELHAKIGPLMLESDFYKTRSSRWDD